MRINVYYSDFKIFPNLEKTISQSWYKTVRFCKNFVEIEWKSANVGCVEDGTRNRNTMFLNPYRQAELFTKTGCYHLC